MMEVDSHVDDEVLHTPVYDDDNPVMHFTLRGDLESLTSVIEEISDQEQEALLDKLNLRNGYGKTPLEMACILGKDGILSELIKRGADVNSHTSNGYTPLHIAACWGSRPCLEILVDNGANLGARNIHGETARHAAMRYSMEECTQYLDWAGLYAMTQLQFQDGILGSLQDARKTLRDFITNLREMMSDPEKLQGVKLTKDEKSTVQSACTEKQEWLDTNPEATASDFLLKKEELEKDVEAVTTKVNSPPPNTGSTGKK